MNYLNVLAKALYDNVAESPDELSFRKGDIMTVLERNTQGLDGWWLCSLHGRQGIVPGNRLKILVGMYDKKQAGPGPGTSHPEHPLPHQAPSGNHQGVYNAQPASSQYTPMHPAYPSQEEDNTYLIPAQSLGQEGLYQVPQGAQSPPAKKPILHQKNLHHHLLQSKAQDIYRVPQSMNSPQDLYQVPPSKNPAHELYQIPVSVAKPLQDIYQVPPSCAPRMEDIELVPPFTTSPQSIYQVPQPMEKGSWEATNAPEKVLLPPRVIPVNECDSANPEQDEYDVPRHLLSGGPLEIYDVLPTRGGPPPSSYSKEIYDIPPTSKGNCDGATREDTYDTPPRKLGGPVFLQDVYDIPRGAHTGKVSLENEEEYIYDVPPQPDREAKAVEDLTGNFKRLSASSTGSTRSNISNSSLDTIPVKESAVVPPKPPVRELNVDLDVAMEMLAKLQHNVASSVSHLMSFISGSWRSHQQMEIHAQAIKTSAENVQTRVREFLEFARGAVSNATQASDRTLHTKLSKQLQKMEDIYQALLKHSQALDSCNWALNALVINKPGTSDDLDHFIMYSRGIPDDTKQLASFLHGNASLLFKRTRQKSVVVDAQTGLENARHTANTLSIYQTCQSEKPSIQSRPLPSPPKFVAGESPDGPCENNESGWLEDYDYVHLQGKEEFEKTQKELLEKGNIMWQSKEQLVQQPLKQFEWLEPEVMRPINNDISNWTPPAHYKQTPSALSTSDKQLLLFYLEQCETNVTTLTNAIDAFFTSVTSNQPPKIFVANSKFIILSAHKLVFIGDTLSRQAKAQDIRTKVTHYSNLLCDMLKEIVIATKMAALQYPSPSAAMDMVDRVKDLGNGTQQFRIVLEQLAAL
ncbi:breast cancer anti-estrogen resistance protein 1 isoform X2 [Ambystoma mexicanum]|uniref:breast cancer anti-estrogen resistance protein 1 isoform X2 n=1 Tax=Ambystoma mexicanum TaxID=8296 RepID=UPI0037E87F0B